MIPLKVHAVTNCLVIVCTDIVKGDFPLRVRVRLLFYVYY